MTDQELSTLKQGLEELRRQHDKDTYARELHCSWATEADKKQLQRAVGQSEGIQMAINHIDRIRKANRE